MERDTYVTPTFDEGIDSILFYNDRCVKCRKLAGRAGKYSRGKLATESIFGEKAALTLAGPSGFSYPKTFYVLKRDNSVKGGLHAIFSLADTIGLFSVIKLTIFLAYYELVT